MKMDKIIAAILAFLELFTVIGALGDYNYSIDAAAPGKAAGNKVSNVNVWEMGTQFIDAQNESENDIYEFVEYVQLMQCTGGNAQRDLFADPLDRSVTDDYDFSRLIGNCRGILSLGAKPCLKLGNTPLKLTQTPEIGGFGVNILPPDDYDVYYDYISALAKALVDAFGREEVLRWHFTVSTEYENTDWFRCGTPEETFRAFCKLYDCTVQALIDNIGEDVYVGAHSMTTTEGYWDERDFIRHCAAGTNYKTGAKGTRLCCLSASYYESEPGITGDRKDLVQTIRHLRKAAEQAGLALDYGVDEGRVLSSKPGNESAELLSRTVGYRWQAAFDARLYAQCIENDIGYFSSWTYKSDGLNSGNPTLSFHVANLIAKWKHAKILGVRRLPGGWIPGAEVKAIAALDGDTLRIMAYNYKNDLSYSKSAGLNLRIKNLPIENGRVSATVWTIDDSCNYFDDWLADREAYGIDDSCFGWSPDCPNIAGSLRDAQARTLYYETLKANYAEKSKLVPTQTELEVRDGTLLLNTALDANTVVFFEIRMGN